MKIVHICATSNFFNPNLGYQDNLLSKYHSKLGHAVTIIAPTYDHVDGDTGKIVEVTASETIINNNIKLVRIKPVLPISVNQHVHLCCGVKKALKKDKPEFIFVHGIASPNYRMLANYKRNHPDVQMVFDSHADLVNSCHNSWSKLFTKVCGCWWVMQRVKAAANYFYGVTPARCDFLKKMYGAPHKKVRLLPMGADDEEMRFDHRDKMRREVRQRYGIANDDFLIVTGGKIDWLKNIHTLAEAVAGMGSKHIKLLVFGSIRDELKPVFDRLCSDRVQLVGWVNSSEVYRYFYAADLVCFPGLHSVLWEQAAASQVPLAVSRIDGFEHVDFGGNCLFLEQKDADYYRHTIELLATDKSRYDDMLLKARGDGSKSFLYSHIAKQVIDDSFPNS